jgi:hypothetical protein
LNRLIAVGYPRSSGYQDWANELTKITDHSGAGMILFLDYDGVLHPEQVYLVDGRPKFRGEGTLFMWAPILIKALSPFPKVKIVLSTSWVRLRGFNRAKKSAAW